MTGLPVVVDINNRASYQASLAAMQRP